MAATKNSIYKNVFNKSQTTVPSPTMEAVSGWSDGYGLGNSSNLAKSLVNGPEVYANASNGLVSNYFSKPLPTEETIGNMMNELAGVDSNALAGTVFDGTSIINKDSGLGNPSSGVGDWFSDNKSMIGAGIGLGQLGLGYLNYSANKKGLESDLKSAEQARRLNEEAAQNKRNIQSKTQSALRFA